MSKVIIAGDAIAISSSMKLEELKQIEKYRPEALVLKGGEDGKDLIFAIGTTTGPGNINSIGISFGRESNDGNKLATVTMVVPAGIDGENVKEWVADQIGGALSNLNKLEETLPHVIEEINAEKQRVMSGIFVAQ